MVMVTKDLSCSDKSSISVSPVSTKNTRADSAKKEEQSSWFDKMDGMSLVCNVGAATAACFDLVEDWDTIGHHHGVLLLSGSKLCRRLKLLKGSKLCREVNTLRGAAVSTSPTTESKRNHPTRHEMALWWSSFVNGLVRVLSSNTLTVGLACAALVAALVEVVRDAEPGGQHGALLLALNDLLDLLQASTIARGRLLRVIQNQYLRLVLASGATLLALVETVQSLQDGQISAHHGVLILGVSKTINCIGILRTSLRQGEKQD